MQNFKPDRQIEEEQTVTDAVSNVLSQIAVPNIVVIGKTGSGKSSLINAVFDIESAKTGAGLPITNEFDLYQNPSVNIYDSAGYEVGQKYDFLKNVVKFIQDKDLSTEREKIHLVWYIINAASARIEHFDLEIIDQLCKRNIPLLIVLSQADRARQEEIESLQLVLTTHEITQGSEILEVAASPLKIRGKLICEPFGLSELVSRSIAKIPEIYADSINMAQVVDFMAKRELAWKFVAAATTAIFSSGFTPIPLTNTTATLGLQTSLFLSIATVYGFGNTQKILPLIYKGMTSGPSLGMIAGVALSDLLKSAIPLAGYLLNGATSAAFIAIVGMAYILAFEAIGKARLDRNNPQEMEDLFIKVYRQKLTEYSELSHQVDRNFKNIENMFLEKSRKQPSSPEKASDLPEVKVTIYVGNAYTNRISEIAQSLHSMGLNVEQIRSSNGTIEGRVSLNELKRIESMEGIHGVTLYSHTADGLEAG